MNGVSLEFRMKIVPGQRKPMDAQATEDGLVVLITPKRATEIAEAYPEENLGESLGALVRLGCDLPYDSAYLDRWAKPQKGHCPECEGKVEAVISEGRWRLAEHQDCSASGRLVDRFERESEEEPPLIDAVADHWQVRVEKPNKRLASS